MHVHLRKGTISLFKKIRIFYKKNSKCLFTSFIIEHNPPIGIADHATKLFHRMFPDSEMAKKYSCGRTKTSAIINEMANNVRQCMVLDLNGKAYTVSTDGSNDGDM